MAEPTKPPYDAAAKDAFDYVRRMMWIGAKNRVLDQPDVLGVPFMDWGVRIACVNDMRKETDKALAPMEERRMTEFNKRLVDKYGWTTVGKTVNASPETVAEELAEMKFETYGQAVDIYAHYALVYGCGNCMEQSALTFQYLRDRAVRPLDWIAQGGYFNPQGLGDHAFVIIGRDGKKDVGDVASWNAGVFWCDPYENEMGGLDKIKERFKGKSLSLMYRLE